MTEPLEAGVREPVASGRDGDLPRALFLDRDGVIHEETGYLFRAEDVRFLPGIFPLLRRAQRMGYRLIVVTNQSGIARGLYTTEDFDRLMTWMRERLAEEDVHLTAVYHCPYHPEHGVGELRREHPDRKPGPGMLLRAAREHGLDLSRSVMLGDRCSDVAAGNAAAVRETMLLVDGPDAPAAAGCVGRHRLVRSLAEAEKLLQQLG